MNFRLITDDDGHWYIIPAVREDDWYGWLATEDYAYSELPVWAIPVDGPHAVTFSSYLVKL